VIFKLSVYVLVVVAMCLEVERRGEIHLCVYVLCVMCLGGVRFIYVFMCYVLERGEVHLCVM
jgi:hypothetical protein